MVGNRERPGSNPPQRENAQELQGSSLLPEKPRDHSEQAERYFEAAAMDEAKKILVGMRQDIMSGKDAAVGQKLQALKKLLPEMLSEIDDIDTNFEKYQALKDIPSKRNNVELYQSNIMTNWGKLRERIIKRQRDLE